MKDETKKSDKMESNNGKLLYIEEHFKKLKLKISYLEELFKKNRREEALLLCCCYIEGLGNYLYWPREGSHCNFVYALTEHDCNETFSLVYLKHFQETAKPKKLMSIVKKLKNLLENRKDNFYSQMDILYLAKANFNRDEFKILKDNIWRGTIASIVYERIRCRLVHNLSAFDITFSEMTFKGKSVPDIDFPILCQALLRIIEKTEKISLEKVSWYGHDFKGKSDKYI